MAITIGLVAIVLISVMFMQFKVIEITDINELETMREADLRTMISSWKTNYEDVSQKLADNKAKINEYEQKIENNQEASELLEKEWEQSNMLVGKTDVSGEGVIITLTDTDENSIEATDLIELVNELHYAGAEAISINDQRIISMTDIVNIASGSTYFIKVNEARIQSPYIVKAIGDQKYLSSSLNFKNSGFIDKYKNTGKDVKLQEQKNIQIPRYEPEMEIKYMKEGE